MRAVNLIPVEARKGGGAGGLGRSGGLVYVVLGGLTVLVALAAMYGLTSSKIGDNRSELKVIQQRSAEAQSRLAEDAGGATLAQTSAAKALTVKQLAESRTDWAATFDAIARTLPTTTTLTTIDASTTPAAAAPGAAPAPGAPGSGPSVKMAGCAPSQRAVAMLMPRLRTVPGVETVSLGSSTAAEGGSTAAAGAGVAKCGGVTFEMTLALAAKPAPAPAAAPGAATPGATGAAPAPAAPAPAPATATPTAQPAAAQTAVPGTPTSGGTAP
jgi:Tfp pilus assembly protein PilN